MGSRNVVVSRIQRSGVGVGVAAVVVWFVGSSLLASTAPLTTPTCPGDSAPMPWGGCADVGSPLAILLGAMAVFVLFATWRGRRWASVALAAFLGLLGLAVAYPVHAVTKSTCGGGAISLGTLEGSLCASPGEIGAGVAVVLFVVLVVVAILSSSRSLLPEYVLGSFLLLTIGGVWLRNVPSPPAFVGDQQLQLRIETKDLANNAALLRPGQTVQLVLVGQDNLPEQTFPGLLVLGLYAADGHSVTYTGELPDNVVVSVPANQLDSIVTALNEKKQPAYLQGQVGAAATPTPLVGPSPTPILATVPLLISKIQPPDPGVVQRGHSVVLLLVEQHTDPGTKVPLTGTHRYDAVVSRCDDKYVYVSMERGSRDTTIENVADQLASMQAIYVLSPTVASANEPSAPQASDPCTAVPNRATD